MKKILNSAILGFAISGLMVGCGSPDLDFQQCKIENVKAPSWVCDGGATMEGGIFGVGSSEKSPLGISFQRTEATAAARDALARQLKVKVKNMFKQFQATTGVGDAQTADKATQNVSKQLASEVLSGSKVIKVWFSPSRTMYVLVDMPNTKEVAQQVKKAVKTSFRNDQALWQEFKAKKADEELEAAIDKEFK